MCGRYRTEYDPEDWSDTRLTPYLPLLFGSPSDDVRPGTVQPILTGGAQWSVRDARWGFAPAWARDAKPPINARSETAFTKPMFREAMRKRRCVVATSGFYEWKTTPRGKSKQLIARRDRQPLLLGAIFEESRSPEPASFAILTCDSSKDVVDIHDRMPVVLEESSLDRWLDPKNTDERTLADLLVPAPGGTLEVSVATERKDPRQGSLF